MSNLSIKKATKLDVQRRGNVDIKKGSQTDDFEEGT